MARQLPPKPPSPQFVQKGPEPPPEQVPFPAGGGGPVARNKQKPPRQRNDRGHFVPQSQANGQHQPSYFPQAVAQGYPTAEDVQRVIGQGGPLELQEYVDEPQPGPATSFPPMTDDERSAIDSLEIIRLAADSGMITLASYVLSGLSAFRHEYFQKHQRIISLPQAWGLLVGTVNLTLPGE